MKRIKLNIKIRVRIRGSQNLDLLKVTRVIAPMIQRLRSMKVVVEGRVNGLVILHRN